MNNPKLIGSNLIDCIPQTGKCPVACDDECFYNRGFYRTLDEPLFPTREESVGKIVRVNSGGDSNHQRQYVIDSTKHYEHKFYNTSIPQFDFDAHVVFTCNGRGPLYVDCPSNVMFVRIRTNTWDLHLQDTLVDHYLEQNVPVVLTFMRYYNKKSMPFLDRIFHYRWKKHILNEYWCPSPAAKRFVLGRYVGRGVRMCGTLVSDLCVDCRNCEMLYYSHIDTR